MRLGFRRFGARDVCAPESKDSWFVANSNALPPRTADP